MQTGLGQPRNLCSKHKTKLWKFKGDLEGAGWEEEKQKTSNIVRTASFHMCRYMYYRYIYKYYCGEKRRGGYHGLKRSQQIKENPLDGSKREFC